MTAENASLLRAPRRSFATHVLPALAYAVGIFYAGLIPMGALPEVGFVATDKLLHAAVFGGQSLLLALAADWLRPTGSLEKKLLCGALGSALLGLALELCQSLVPYRSADPWDWVADTVGALLLAACSYTVLRWLGRRAHG